MSHTLTIRLQDDLAEWVEQTAQAMGVSQGRLIRDQLEKARREDVRTQRYMRLAGSVRLARDLSTRKGVLVVVMGIADTGFLVAFANARDIHHDWAISVARRVSPPCLTCEGVLAEAAFHLSSVALVLAMIEDGFIRLAFDAASHVDRLAELGVEVRRPVA